MGLLIHVILSVFFGISFAILLVEKGDSWPVEVFTKRLKFVLAKIYPKLAEVLDCTVCCSFWTTLIGELVLYFFYTHIFMWPFTGVISLGLVWCIIEFFNSIDRSKSA